MNESVVGVIERIVTAYIEKHPVAEVDRIVQLTRQLVTILTEPAARPGPDASRGPSAPPQAEVSSPAAPAVQAASVASRRNRRVFETEEYPDDSPVEVIKGVASIQPKVFGQLYDAQGRRRLRDPSVDGPGWDPADSVRFHYLRCLEDSKKVKILSRYLRTTYGISMEDYRRRWNLPSTYPSGCEAYSRKRREIGLRGALLGRGAVHLKTAITADKPS